MDSGNTYHREPKNTLKRVTETELRLTGLLQVIYTVGVKKQLPGEMKTEI